MSVRSPTTPSRNASSQEITHESIRTFLDSDQWNAHWNQSPRFELPAQLAGLISQSQAALVSKHLACVQSRYTSMRSVGLFDATARLFSDLHNSRSPFRPPLPPTTIFAAGLSGFDRIDEHGWDRAGYQAVDGHSQEGWEDRTQHQIALAMEMSRIFKIPAGQTVAYDPCYSIVDVVLLAALGIRALRKGEADLKRLRVFNTPTLFYAPGAEEHVVSDALLRTPDIANLIYVGSDLMGWWEHREEILAFANSSRSLPLPEHLVVPPKGEAREAPCGQGLCLQWIPTGDSVAEFNRVRGPAREPATRRLEMPDGSTEYDD